MKSSQKRGGVKNYPKYADYKYKNLADREEGKGSPKFQNICGRHRSKPPNDGAATRAGFGTKISFCSVAHIKTSFFSQPPLFLLRWLAEKFRRENPILQTKYNFSNNDPQTFSTNLNYHFIPACSFN